MPISTVMISVTVKRRFWLMPAMRLMQLAAQVGILKEKHVEEVAHFLAYKGIRVIAERSPS